ncbi:hypothetical protein E0L36_02360 [Streptomyces sp. AJS327]|uniref:hypothetical protein n=1 Tax=Streptomyces sp. AJS327 TaxID=2545265 RepID=UPI0015DE14E7|nr:hypothetical protein [Streptomyces sp. AJS327]MBA0049786.1 hypothetical protein [Streptomyces sp. AJS327]
MLGLTLPVLHRIARRWEMPRHGCDRAELEQEMLTATLTALARPAGREVVSPEKELFRAADRAARSLVTSARRRHRRETPLACGVESDGHALAGRLEGEAESTRHEYTVLAEAVEACVITMTEAQLIARTRLDSASVLDVACEQGSNRRTLSDTRKNAERRLGAWLVAKQ